MMTPSFLDSTCYKPKLGSKIDFGIGIVGAGAIVEAAHLPAYRKAGFNIIGISDLRIERAQQLADKFEIPRVYRSLEEMLLDPKVEIVDIAVPPSFQPGILGSVLQAGKDILGQKPLAETLAEAKLLVEQAIQRNCTLAVNENMRWDPAIRASRHLIREGWIGSPVLATLEVNYWENWSSWPWLIDTERLTILFDAIHPIYSFRMLFGEPTGVYCVTGRTPNQKERGETRAVLTMEFANGMTGLLLDCSRNPTNDQFATFRFDGTDGSIKGTLGIWYNYPFGRADTLEFSSKTKSPGIWISAELEGRWVPDAFIGPMGALMRAIEENKEPENSGKEHLKTLSVVEAAYQSDRERRRVSPQDF